MSKINLICGAKNILARPMSLILQNYFFMTVKDQLDIFPTIAVGMPVARHPRTDHDPPNVKCTQISDLIHADEYARIPFNFLRFEKYLVSPFP
jgi:hypothetical protein